MTYIFYELKEKYPRGGDPLPEDVNSYVMDELAPIFKAFPDIEADTRKMEAQARLKKDYTDKTRALIMHPTKKVPIITMEFHHGIIKQFSLAVFYGDLVYFPINVKNHSVAFVGKKNKTINSKQE